MQSEVRRRSQKKRRRAESVAPSSMSSTSREKYVYAGVINMKYQIEWYSFVLDGGGNKPIKGFADHIPFPVLTPIMAYKVSEFSSCAVIDSTLYCFGGRSRRRRLLDKVHSFDTTQHRPGKESQSQSSFWEERPSMLIARDISRAVVLDKKIYVVGGTKDFDRDEPWAEVYDPKSSKWLSLTPPPTRPTAYGLFAAALPSQDKILVGSNQDSFLYTYSAKEKYWERCEHKMPYGPYMNVKPVVVDNTLFWFYNCKFHAYDILEEWCHVGYIEDLENVMPHQCLDVDNINWDPVLLHIAGSVFCLVCLEYQHCNARTLLHCIKFSVSKLAVPSGGKFLNASVQSCQTYIINNSADLIYDALLVDEADSSPEKA